MAYYSRPRFTRPPMNSNFPRANFNMNPGVGRPPPRFFQRPPSMPFQSFSGPDPSQGTFMGRPRFPTFGETEFRYRPAVSEGMSSNVRPPFGPPDIKPTLRPPFGPPDIKPTLMPPSIPSTPNRGPALRPNIGISPRPPDIRPAGRFHQNVGSSLMPPNMGSSSRFQNFGPGPSVRPPNVGSQLRPRYSGGPAYERHYAPWNQQPSFSNPRSSFRNGTRSPFPPSFSKDVSFSKAKNKKRKTQKFRDKDERKLKEKDDGSEKPFSCDTCDRAFVSEDELNAHLSQHIKCDYSGCQFEAHPKIVMLHKKMQHDTGYAEVINKLSDDKEIEKWREERRSRFPTAENILKRKAEQAEKEARGEVLETKEFGKFKRQRFERNGMKFFNGRHARNRNGHPNHRKFHFKGNNSVEFPSSRAATNGHCSESDSDSDSHITLHKFLGMSTLMDCVELINDTDEIHQDSKKSINSSVPGMYELTSKKASNMVGNHCVFKKPSDIVRKKLNVEFVELDQDPCLLSCDQLKECQKEPLAKELDICIQNGISNFSNGCNSGSPLNECTILEDESANFELNDDLSKIGQFIATNNTPLCFSPRSSSPASVELVSENSVDEISVLSTCDGTKDNPIIIECEMLDDSNERNPSILSRNATSEAKCGKIAECSDMYGSKANPIDIEDSDDEPPVEIPIVKSELKEMISEPQSDSDNKPPAEIPVLKDAKTAISKSVPTGTLSSLDERVCNGDKSHSSHGEKASGPQKENKDFMKSSFKHPAFASRKSTLLEKLLAPEIRHERNVILQCVHHIVKNNFFGIGSKSH